MAAVQWSSGKCHGATEAIASIMHNDREKRMKCNHRNPDIDVTKTPDNFSYRGPTFTQKCQKYNALMDKVKIKRKSSGKNANVTLQNLVIPIPAEMQQEDKYDPQLVKAWADDVGKLLERRYGELLIDVDGHTDEIHLYLDPKKERDDPARYVWSRVHLHAAVIPAITEKIKDKDGNIIYDDDGQPKTELVLNSFKFSAKKNIQSLNDEIQRMTSEKYGMKFMDGSGKGKKHSTVENLKAWSAEAMRDEGLILADQKIQQERTAKAQRHAMREIHKNLRLLGTDKESFKTWSEVYEAFEKGVSAVKRDAQAEAEEKLARERAALSQKEQALDAALNRELDFTSPAGTAVRVLDIVLSQIGQKAPERRPAIFSLQTLIKRNEKFINTQIAAEREQLRQRRQAMRDGIDPLNYIQHDISYQYEK